MAVRSDVLETMPVSPYARLVRAGLRFWAVVAVAFLYLPVVLLVLFSFEDSKNIGFPITGVSLRWYLGLPGKTVLLGAIGNSILVAIIVALVATIVGTMAAFPLVRGGLRYPAGVRVLFTMPIMLPGLLIGVGLVVFIFGTLKLRSLGLLPVVAGHLVLTMPFVVLIVAARLQGFDRRLEWAAADLGAGPATVIRLIVLPLIFPAILAAALLSVTLSIDEFVVTFFTIGSQVTLPIYIYTQIKFGVTPEINAVATLVLVGTVLALGLGYASARIGRSAVRRARGS